MKYPDPSIAFARTLTATLLIGLTVGCGKPDTLPPDARPWTAFLEDLITFDHLPVLDDADIRMVSSSDPRGGNNDFNNFQARSRESGWVVLLDEQGPGCIRRFWMTGTDPGHPVRVYIDGEREPRIEGSLEEVFGNMNPWLPPLAQYQNMCFYSYVPIPYNRSIRIETREPNVHAIWGPRRIFYQLSVERFSDGRSVESYPATLTAAQLEVAERVREAWTHSLESRDISWTNEESAERIAAGQRHDVLAQSGPATVHAWRLDVQPANPDDWSIVEREYLLQDVVLRVYYEGRDVASIAVPLGDLFANGWCKRELGNLWMTSGPDGYSFRLPMPFRESIRIELENGAEREVRVRFEADIDHVVADDAGYFHAEWRRSGPNGGGHHPITQVEGRGKFLGCFLGVTGTDASWWILEGDERMWVDDSTAPVWDGTGLEDYFNGGWYYRGAVFGALSASFDRSPFRVAQYRHQHPDPVSFGRNFRMEFERMRQPQTGAPVQGYFQSVAYFYLEHPASVMAPPPDRAQRRALPDPYYPQTLMLQLVELERMNDFRSAKRAVAEYLERFPTAEDVGIYQLRHLEYRRHLDQDVGETALQPFLDGEHGEAAQEQARLLHWFYEQNNRAIIGMNVNGLGRLYLNGRTILTGDHPYHLFVTGVEMSDGPQTFAAQVEMRRHEPWFQAGVRTHTGVAGTGMGTLSTLDLVSGWRTESVSAPPWHSIGIRDVPRGVPDAPYIGGMANAFILVQSKSYPVRALNWGHHQGNSYYRHDFTVPVDGWPATARDMTGLLR